MFEVVSVTEFSELDQTCARASITSRRGGFVHGTKIATTSGWKPVERIVAGDLVRTLDHGFKEVRRVSTDRIAISANESRADFLPVFVPSRAAYNGRPVWLMPEQGLAVDHTRIEGEDTGISVVSARLLNGVGKMRSQAPGETFDVSTLFFDMDEIVFLDGGLQAYCPAGRFGLCQQQSSATPYMVVDTEDAEYLIDSIATRGDLSALANPLGALPAPIPQEPIFPIRPQLGVRRPGRPGRPDTPALFLRSEWQT